MPDIRLIHDGSRNLSIQIVGKGPLDWQTVVDLETLDPRPKEVRLDAVYYAVGEGTEVQFAWSSDKDGNEPFLPISGRGKIDFSEVSGIHNTAEGKNGHVEMAVFGSGIFTIVLDLSKHIGA